MQEYSRKGTLNLKKMAVWVTLLCILHLSFLSMDQLASAQLTKVTLQDKGLERVLQDYENTSKAKVIAVFIERYDGGYMYTLRSFGFFDTVKNNPTTVYGQWKDCILLFTQG